MNRTRSSLLVAALLTLLVSACGQPDDLASPPLEPQYGTALEDAGLQVATTAMGHIFTLGTISEPLDTHYSDPVLKRFDASGKELWSRKLGNQCYSHDCSARGYLSTDAIGNSYALYGVKANFGDVTYDATLKKFSPVGNLQWTRPVYLQKNLSGNTAMATAAGGDTFVAYEFRQRDPEDWDSETSSSHLVKYNTKGQKLFEKTLVIDHPSDAVVAGDGSLYVVGAGELAKYSSAGNLVWQRALPQVPNSDIEQVAVGGGNVYVSVNTDSGTNFPQGKNLIDLYKYTTSGSMVWKRTLTPTKSAGMSGLSADASGNAYLTGATTDTNTGSLDLFVRKHTPSGGVAWTYRAALPGSREVANDVSAADSNKIYVVGTTDGKVNGVNKGGNDAFLIRLNGQGGKVWSR